MTGGWIKVCRGGYATHSAKLIRPPTDVSLNVFPLTMRPLNAVSPGRCGPIRFIPYWGGLGER
jgi:hypothetical protein